MGLAWVFSDPCPWRQPVTNSNGVAATRTSWLPGRPLQQWAMANIFALRDTGLNAFLFSDTGREFNGTGLTILSLLA